MSEFLELNTPIRFWKVFAENLKMKELEKETIDFLKSRGRIVAEDILSPVNLPPFARSTVDGFAVRAKDTSGASESLPVYLNVLAEVLMGENADIKMNAGEAVKIPTGGMLPADADAVIMVEYTDYLDENMIETAASVAVGENVVKCGEDIAKGNILLHKGHRIRPQDIGALAGLGITEIEVFKKPLVTVISTGDELIPPDKTPEKGEIRDINSYTIAAVLEETGARIRYAGIVSDTFSELKDVVEKNLDSDLVLISGGSSVGVKDMTIDVLNTLGEPGVVLHGVSIKPGKPTIMAFIDDVPVMGMPGHPASSWTITNQFIKGIVNKLSAEKIKSFPHIIKAVLSRNLVSDKGREEYVPVSLKKDNSSYIAEPITGKSSLITTFVEADGYLIIGHYQEGLNKDDLIDVYLY